MPERMFDEQGRLRIPERIAERRPGSGERVVVNAAYCPLGHNLVSLDHEIGGFPAILLAYRGSLGTGRIALSAVFGDPTRRIVDGSVEEGETLELSCSTCGTPLDVLGECGCVPGALSVVAYLYPRKDPYQAIAFCSSLACDNSAVIRAGEAIRIHIDRPWQH
jgi:hypothetical protein